VPLPPGFGVSRRARAALPRAPANARALCARAGRGKGLFDPSKRSKDRLAEMNRALASVLPPLPNPFPSLRSGSSDHPLPPAVDERSASLHKGRGARLGALRSPENPRRGTRVGMSRLHEPISSLRLQTTRPRTKRGLEGSSGSRDCASTNPESRIPNPSSHTNFLNRTRFGLAPSSPRRRFLSSSYSR